jgi:DNA-directed RNA polymerase specialized sigma24 family protein
MQFQAEHPLAYYGTLSVAMSACLYLFVTVARDLEGLKRKVDRRQSEIERNAGITGAQVATLETRLGEWAGRTREVEEKVSSLAALRRPQAMSTGVDANQRTQVIRMARRGDRPEQIAAELRVPKSEVELLLKVQRAVVRVF